MEQTIPTGKKLCACGCDELIAASNKSGPLYYKHNHHRKGRKFPGERKGRQLGAAHPNWRGGKIQRRTGYVYVRSEGHPRAWKDGKYVPEHVLLMEKLIGRYLERNEVVHHINGIKNDNRIENLMLFKNHSEHMALYHGRRRNARTS